MVIICGVLLCIFLIWSLLFSSGGTFTTMRDLISPDVWLDGGMSVTSSAAFESKGEKISRRCLQNIYNLPFKNTRLDSIKNPDTGRSLEIDCYNPELKLGVEYHGINHYKFIPYFHQTREKFVKSQLRDAWKLQICNRLGITLIVVPYTCSHDKICKFIISELDRHGRTDHVTGWNDDVNVNK